MPSVDSSRVKTTGTGEIFYTNDPNANSTTVTNTSETDTPILSVVGQNIGQGVGIYAGSNGLDKTVLEFKTIVAGQGITLLENAETITIIADANATGNGISVSDGFDIQLGNPPVSWSDGALTFSNSQTVSYTFDQINSILGLLIPAKPANFPNASLSITNSSGNTPLLAIGVQNNTGGSTGLNAGSAVTRIIASSAISNTFNDVGPADIGNVQLLVNGGFVSDIGLTSGIDNTTLNGLTISDEKDYPSDKPGFWKSLDIAVSGAASNIGINKIKINHTGAGSTSEVFYVRDTMTSTGTITNGVVTQSSAGALSYSSGIPHYNSGAQLSVSCALNNLSGETYYGGSDILTISGTNSILSNQIFGYSNLGITVPMSRNNTSFTQTSNFMVNINGSGHTKGVIQGVFKNVNGSSAITTVSSKQILLKSGSAGSKIDEMSVPVTGLGSLPNSNNAVRVDNGAGDTPTGVPTTWLSSTALQSYDAAIVAGVLEHCVTDFSSGDYLPVGPNLSSGRTGPQYITFSFKRSSVSAFKINVTGTYSSCWVKLVGISDNSTISPNSTSGWWKPTVAYNGAGVPGRNGDLTAGAAIGTPMAGTSGTYTVTFGTESSSNATNNEILIRFRLNAGQSITSLSFSNV